LALGLLGEGQMWDPEEKRYTLAADVLKRHALTPLEYVSLVGCLVGWLVGWLVVWLFGWLLVS
jgi:hypothetical protein